MTVLAALIGLMVAWGTHLMGAALTRGARAARGTAGKAGQPDLAPAILRLALAALPGREAPVDWRTVAPLAAIEAAGAVFFAAWSTHMALTWQGLMPAAWFCFFALVATTDLAARWVPNALVYPAAGIALAAHWLTGDQTLPVSLLGGALSYGVFALAAWVKPGGLGGGDIKLAAVMGLLFGFPNVLWALLLGGALGAMVAAALLAGKWGSKTMRIPYAPFLCIGAVSALVYSPIPALLKA